jgi:hypothetical protein
MVNEMRDRLVELLRNTDINCENTKYCDNCVGYSKGAECINYLIADYILNDGWIRPPMKLGQMCFKPCYSAWSDEVRQYRVSSITQKADGSFKMRLTDLITKSVFEITPDEIGKTVFLTKEEAEQKLKEMRGG